MPLNLAPHHGTRIGLGVIFLLGQVGCASRPYMLPPPPSEQVRAQFGTVGVVVARFVPPTALQEPARGAIAGAGRGIAIGMAAGVAGASGTYLGSGILLLPIIGLVGGIVGAATAPPAAAVEEAEATLRKAMTDVREGKVQEALRDRLVAVAQGHMRRRVVPLPAQEPSASDAPVSYRALTSEEIDTVLEVAVHQLGLAGAWGPDPPLAVVLTVRTRLVRVVDGTDLYTNTLNYQSAPRKFTEWAANNAQPFRNELDQAYAILAEKIVEEVFLLYLLGDLGPESPGRLPIRSVATRPRAQG